MTNLNFNLKAFIKSCISFRYLSNFAIIASLLAYYTNAISIFFITIPIMITNFIIIMIIQIYDYNELLNGIFSLALTTAEIADIKNTFFIINIIWHVVPLLWLYKILDNDNIIYIFRPNFINIFFQSLAITIPYFYYSSTMKVYGNINYLYYCGIYIGIMFVICYSIYNNNYL